MLRIALDASLARVVLGWEAKTSLDEGLPATVDWIRESMVREQSPHAPLRAAILAGGSGTRLWPLSRSHRPKQLLALLGDRSLIQDTVDRVAPSFPHDQILVVTEATHADDLREQLPELPAAGKHYCRADPSPWYGGSRRARGDDHRPPGSEGYDGLPSL